jgi:shikimate kinase
MLDKTLNIYLIGYRGSGKTSVGKMLARLLNRPFLDMDAEAVQAAGASIQDMVAHHGWEAFRRLESNIVKQTALRSGHIVATGGGVVLDADNIRRMKSSGRVIWLRIRHETARIRIAGDRATIDQRPGLTTAGCMDEVESVMRDRAPLYEKASDLTVDTDDLDIETICRYILSILTSTEAV